VRFIGGKDYYDAGLKFGVDESIIFVRSRPDNKVYNPKNFPDEVVELVERLFVDHDFVRKDREWATICSSSYFVIGDTLYRGYSLDYAFYDLRAVNDAYAWTKNDLLDNMKCDIDDICINGLESFSSKRVKLNFLDEYFTPQKLKPREIELMISQKITVMAKYILNYGGDCVTVNCDDLKNIQAYKILDPYTAYQKIEQWISGVLPFPGAEMVEVSDKTRISKHGFDKASFRKPKEKAIAQRN